MDGIIPLWKEKGMTSHDCVFKVRKILKMKKVGHGGTLDPQVDGVLPICVGRGTKILDYLQEHAKTYVGEITLGFSTMTEDAEGEVVAEKRVTQPLDVHAIDEQMTSFVGEIEQIPPMYSAVKVNGKRLYEYARAGLQVERPVRKAMIYSFKRLTEPVFDSEQGTLSWQFEVTCSKGTYVRTLAVDLGEKLGYPAHMSSLTRMASGGLKAGQCVTLEQMASEMEKLDAGEVPSFLQPLESCFADFTRVDLTKEQYQRVKNGMDMPLSMIAKEVSVQDTVACFYQNQLAALYQVHPEKKNTLKVKKMLRNDID